MDNQKGLAEMSRSTTIQERMSTGRAVGGRDGFEDRLLVEIKELNHKVISLREFLNDAPSTDISQIQRSLLELQLGYMGNYERVLMLRKENLKI